MRIPFLSFISLPWLPLRHPLDSLSQTDREVFEDSLICRVGEDCERLLTFGEVCFNILEQCKDSAYFTTTLDADVADDHRFSALFKGEQLWWVIGLLCYGFALPEKDKEFRILYLWEITFS